MKKMLFTLIIMGNILLQYNCKQSTEKCFDIEKCQEQKKQTLAIDKKIKISIDSFFNQDNGWNYVYRLRVTNLSDSIIVINTYKGWLTAYKLDTVYRLKNLGFHRYNIDSCRCKYMGREDNSSAAFRKKPISVLPNNSYSFISNSWGNHRPQYNTIFLELDYFPSVNSYKDDKSLTIGTYFYVNGNNIQQLE